jgi:hypothetical protein
LAVLQRRRKKTAEMATVVEFRDLKLIRFSNNVAMIGLKEA